MKKIALILTVFGILSAETRAQRCLQGMKGMEIRYGAVDGNWNARNFYLGAARSIYAKNCNQWVFGAEYLKKGYDYRNMTIPVAQFTGEAGFYRSVLSTPNKFFFFSLGISALAGYETVNWNDKLLPDGATIRNGDRFIIGGILSCRLEFYLADRVALLVDCRERLGFRSSVTNFHNQLGFGLRLMMN